MSLTIYKVGHRKGDSDEERKVVGDVCGHVIWGAGVGMVSDVATDGDVVWPCGTVLILCESSGRVVRGFMKSAMVKKVAGVEKLNVGVCGVAPFYRMEIVISCGYNNCLWMLGNNVVNVVLYGVELPCAG